MANRFKETDTGFGKLMTSMKGKDSGVQVGFLRSSGVYKENPDMTVAQVAAIHEFGSKDGSIPERSFMRTAIHENSNELTKLLKKLTSLIAESKMNEHAAMGHIGEFVKNLIKGRIVSGPFTPNTPETIKRKGSSSPLIDTGQMLASVEYKVTGPSPSPKPTGKEHK
jgi:hypothetical protein